MVSRSGGIWSSSASSSRRSSGASSLKRPDRRSRSMALKRPRRDQPGARVGGHAGRRPLLRRGEEGVGQGLLGEVEVAEQAG